MTEKDQRAAEALVMRACVTGAGWAEMRTLIAEALALARAEGSPQGWQEIAADVKRVVDAMRRDEADGFHSSVRTFVLDILGRHVPAPPAPGSAEEGR